MFSYNFSRFEVDDWAEQIFKQADLGDPRRVQRVIHTARAMAKRPGLSIPCLFDSRYDVKATYTLLHRPEATPDRIQESHRQGVAREARIPGETYLYLEDTSEMLWKDRQPIRGLGPIGRKPTNQGFLLHSVVAIHWTSPSAGQTTRPPVRILGLADQIYQNRVPRPADEANDASFARLKRTRESQIWEQAGERLGKAPEGVRWERVCDRGADIYEFLTHCREVGHGFTVRAAQNRMLVDTEGNVHGHLFETARCAHILGRFDLDLRARPSHPARTAHLAVSALPVGLRSPLRPGFSPGKLPPIECTVVRVFELEPPAGVEPLEWVLLTDVVVETFEAALEVALKYSTRWLIEDFHKALKTGMGAERLQLETAERLFATIAIMSLVALRLVGLREAVRINPDAPAEQSGLSELELKVLRVKLKRPVKTVGEAALAIGRLGGHMNRKSDGWPGWKSLWLGMKHLHLLVQGVQLAPSLP